MRFSKFVLLFLALPSLVFAEGTVQVMPTILPAGSSIPTPAPAPANAPKIFCAKPKFDFHNVDEGGDIIHLFHIVNKGKSTLLISNVSTSCGCTAAVEDKKEIPAGGKGVIKATYHTKGRPGHATKIITIASNDPVNPNYQLQLDMTVVREIDVQPEKVYMYNVPHNQSQTATVKILGKPHTLFKILSVDTQNKAVSVTQVEPISEKESSRQGATLTISVPADRPIGNFTDTIKVMTTSKKHPEVDVDVWGEVVGKFTYAPHSVYFSQHQVSPMVCTFNVTDPTFTKQFVVRKVESAKHLARPSVKKTNYGNGVEQFQVSIEPPKSLPKDSDGKDSIIVTTNDPEQPQVIIDVQMNK